MNNISVPSFKTNFNTPFKGKIPNVQKFASKLQMNTAFFNTLNKELDSNGKKAVERILKEESDLTMGKLLKLIPLYARNLDCKITGEMKKRYFKLFEI